MLPLPPVVSPRFDNSTRGSALTVPSRSRGRALFSGDNMGQYKQAKADALRSAKRRAALKKRAVLKKRAAVKAKKKIRHKKIRHKKINKSKTRKSRVTRKKTHHKKTIKKSPAKAYKVLGEWYTPLATAKGYNETGKASWYGKRFHGGPTANGEKFDMNALTAAHKTLPFNSKVKVTNVKTNSNIVVRINDRGPFRQGYIIDVSAAAADRLGFNGKGDIEVRVESVE
ncbi:MAG: septal ring lytic transglycosylase RlpA family protein [Mariprofundaceae bacterium]|nr:septal ring lytic transglycosylase RlpA family protein [Mariprofundaceae bacterium]